ncbi:MAG: O-antigen ligase family protein [Anaerolineae bacterium]
MSGSRGPMGWHDLFGDPSHARGFLALAVAVGAVMGVLALAPGAAVAVLVAVAIASAAAALRLDLVAGALIVLVLLQDWLVGLGLELAQYGDEVLIVAGVLGIALRFAVTGRARRTPLDAPIAAFVAVGAVSAALRGVPLIVAALGTMSLLKGLLAFEIFARARFSLREAERGVALVLSLIVALAAIGVAQRIGGLPIYALTGRAAYYALWQGGKAPSLMLNHNSLGHLCVLGGLLALGLALAYTGIKSRRMAYAAAACLAGLVVSASRESWLATAAALPAGAYVMRSRRLWRLAAVIALLLVLATAAVYLASPLLREEIVRRSAGVVEGLRAYVMGYRDWGYRGEYRVYVLLKSLEVWRDHLWLGTGPGRFGGQVAMTYLSPVYEQYRFLPLRGEYHPLDVFWSRLLTEFGILGSLAYAWAMVAAAGVHLRARSAHRALSRGLGIGGWMAWVAVIVLGFFAPVLEDPLVAVPFWGWAGLTWALARRGAAGDSGREPDDGEPLSAATIGRVSPATTGSAGARPARQGACAMGAR